MPVSYLTLSVVIIDEIDTLVKSETKENVSILMWQLVLNPESKTKFVGIANSPSPKHSKFFGHWAEVMHECMSQLAFEPYRKD